MPSLYYLSGTDPHDQASDYTLFVVANSPEQAHAIRKNHWWEGDGAPFYNGPVLPKAPPTKREETLLIYGLDYDPGRIGALPWQDVDVVGYVTA